MGTQITDMMSEIRALNTEKGWRDGTNTFGDYIALAHSELSEALEAYRNWKLKDATDHYIPMHRENPKPQGVGSEMADALIRVLDMCDFYGIDIEKEYRRKMDYGWTRDYRHGGRAL